MPQPQIISTPSHILYYAHDNILKPCRGIPVPVYSSFLIMLKLPVFSAIWDTIHGSFSLSLHKYMHLQLSIILKSCTLYTHTIIQPVNLIKIILNVAANIYR